MKKCWQSKFFEMNFIEIIAGKMSTEVQKYKNMVQLDEFLVYKCNRGVEGKVWIF